MKQIDWPREMALDSNSVTFDLPVLNLTFAGPPVKSAQARTLGTGLSYLY